MKSTCGFLLAALLLQPPAPGAAELECAALEGAAYQHALEVFRYTRAVTPERAGWVRVALDAHALGHGLPGDGWWVFGPDGEAVPHAVLRPRSGEVPARTLTVEEGAEGWGIVFDLGPTPLRHRRLEVLPAEPVAARGCRLEGSRDGRSWEYLAEGDLFRLGERQDLVRSFLEYPATEVRYLRLTWPRDAGFPEFQRAFVEVLDEPPEGPVTAELAVTRVDSSEGRASYRLELPAPGIRPERLELRGEGSGAVGYRLYRVERQRRELLREGTFDFLDGASLSLEGPSVSLEGPPWVWGAPPWAWGARSSTGLSSTWSSTSRRTKRRGWRRQAWRSRRAGSCSTRARRARTPWRTGARGSRLRPRGRVLGPRSPLIWGPLRSLWWR